MFLWKPETFLEGTVARDFYLRFFLSMNRPDSTSKTMPKNVELKLPNCGLEIVDCRKNWDCGIAELRLRSNMSLKSCGIAIAEQLPSSCGIAIADSKKSCMCPPLILTLTQTGTLVRDLSQEECTKKSVLVGPPIRNQSNLTCKWVWLTCAGVW